MIWEVLYCLINRNSRICYELTRIGLVPGRWGFIAVGGSIRILEG